MIAIAAISEKLATIAARLTAAWPGAPRSCASASASHGEENDGTSRNAGGGMEAPRHDLESGLRRQPAKNAGAEIGARAPHGELCRGVAEGEAESRADGAERRRLGEDQPRELGALQPHHAQQRVLSPS